MKVEFRFLRVACVQGLSIGNNSRRQILKSEALCKQRVCSQIITNYLWQLDYNSVLTEHLIVKRKKLFNLLQSASRTPYGLFLTRERRVPFKETQEGAWKSADGQLDDTKARRINQPRISKYLYLASRIEMCTNYALLAFRSLLRTIVLKPLRIYAHSNSVPKFSTLMISP